VLRVDLASLGITGTAAGPRGGVTATNVQWHPSGRILAVNVNTQNRVAFLTVTHGPDGPTLAPWGDPVTVGADPFVGRFTPDGRHYVTANWGRDFTATTLEGRLPTRPSTLSVIRLADPDASGAPRHAVVTTADSGPSSEGLAISPDGRLLATINMGTTALAPGTPRFRREASVSLLALDPQSGALRKLSDTPFDGVLPEGGAFDLDGGHFVATVFEGHAGTGPEAGPGLAVFRVERGAEPSLTPLGRLPLPHGVHHVELLR
jgi:hypothetical protein